jgi:hypothetical protein
MQFSAKVRSELARALRNFKYEKSPRGVCFPNADLTIGGVFGAKVDDGPWSWGDNAVTNEGINAMLAAFFDQGAQPNAWYVAPFSNNLSPTSALTAATFASTQGEYTAYTQTARQLWKPDAAPTTQQVQNAAAPASFTIGAATVTVYGAALLSASAKSATTGVSAAAGLFGVANTLNPGSTLTVQYALSATSS